jgi:hypothetical protein
MVAGFSCVCLSTLYAAHVIKTELTLVYKQIDSQPKRVAEEIKLPPASPPPAERPVLNQLPPELIQRILQKH